MAWTVTLSRVAISAADQRGTLTRALLLSTEVGRAGELDGIAELLVELGEGDQEGFDELSVHVLAESLVGLGAGIYDSSDGGCDGFGFLLGHGVSLPQCSS